MSPIIGIIASSVLKVTTSYESIATTTVGAGGSATVTFSSIPQTYTHLQVRIFAKSGRARLQNGGLVMQVNGSYPTYQHSLYGLGSTAGAGAGAGSSSSTFIQVTGTTATNIFGVGVIDILDYATTTKNKTLRALSGDDTNGNGEIYLTSALINSTSAITSISFASTDAVDNIQQYSSFALYGIKG